MSGFENIFLYVFLFTSLYFEVFMLITFFEQSPAEKNKKSVLGGLFSAPSVTIIVPCHNEETSVAGTLDSLLALEYPKERLHLFVVDDGSTDGTYAVAKMYERHPNVTVFRKEKGGKHTALNFGINRATTEFIGGLDADSFVAPYALAEMMRYFEENPDIMAMTPALKVRNPRNILEYIQHAEYSLGIFYRTMFGRLGALFVTPGPLSIYRTEVFERIGLFRSAYNTEDMEMALRMQKNHMRIENAPRAHVETIVPRTLPTLLRQRVRWVQGFLQNAIQYRGIFFNPRYGNLGLLVLPLGVFSIFGAVYFAAYMVVNVFSLLLDKYVQIQTIGFAGLSSSHFDLFYLSTPARLFLVIGLIVMTAFLIMLGKRFAETKIVSRDIVFYFAFYAFIAPLWLAKALYNTALAKESVWK